MSISFSDALLDEELQAVLLTSDLSCKDSDGSKVQSDESHYDCHAIPGSANLAITSSCTLSFAALE
jgi:hypothetical protein